MVNDISSDPVTDADEEALSRIVEYVPNPPVVDTITELEACYRETYEPFFSAMSKEEWRRFTVTSARRTDDGQITPAHDPQIVESITAEEDTMPDPWEVWEAIPANVFIIHGTELGILPRDAFERMCDLQPDAETLAVDSGHAPALNVEEQIEPIRNFFES